MCSWRIDPGNHRLCNRNGLNRENFHAPTNFLMAPPRQLWSFFPEVKLPVTFSILLQLNMLLIIIINVRLKTSF